MNFIIDLLSRKPDDIVYKTIFVIVNKYIKMIKYLSVIIKIDITKLIKSIFEKIVFNFVMSTNIVNHKDFLLINIL